MTLRSRHLAPLIIGVFAAGIGGTMALNLWQTTASKVPATYSSGEFAGQYDPADIRGSYTLGDISSSFAVPVEVLVQAFEVREPADPALFQVKGLEELYAGLAGGEIGTDSVRWFVALYTDRPYTPADDTLLPAGALPLLAGRLSTAELQALQDRAAGERTAAAPPAPQVEAAPDDGAAEPAAGAPGAESAAAAPAGDEHTPEDRTVRGKTTFAELWGWGVSREAVEEVLGGAGKPAATLKDYTAEREIELSTVKDSLQALVDSVP